jgi:hypothetical protein
MPKHLSTVNQGNDVRVANETLQGVDMANYLTISPKLQ